MHCFFFFFNDTATTEIYTLSLHDALPICPAAPAGDDRRGAAGDRPVRRPPPGGGPGDPRHFPGAPAARCAAGDKIDRKSTRLNSSHANISYAVFCLKKKKKTTQLHTLSVQ